MSKTGNHWSDCAVHNEPAMPAGPCDCGADAPTTDTGDMMIDPPEGWRYGFPKPIPHDQLHRTLEWLVEQGYPQHLITPRGVICRYWRRTNDDR